MKAFYCSGSSVMLKHDYPEPVPLDDEIILKVTHCGICDTDVQIASGYMGFQGILGHEFVGVDNRGKRYTAEINNACHNCDWCRKGLMTHCPNRTVLGIYRHDGAMAERVAVPRKNLHEVPDTIADHAAIFIEPLAAAFQVLEQIHLDKTTKACVLGDGKLGILCAWVLSTSTDDVTLVGKHQRKMALAGKGIRQILLDDALSAMNRPYDLVVDATGNSSGLATACRLVRPRGTICLKTTIAGEHQLNLASIVIDELTIIGSRCGPFKKAIASLAANQFPVTNLIEAVYAFDQAEAGFEHARRKGSAKVILEMKK